MELSPKVSALLTNYGYYYVDVWNDQNVLTVEVYLPPEDGVQSRAELKILQERNELLSTGRSKFVYETLKRAVALQYWIDGSNQALDVVKSQLLALKTYVNLEPSHRQTRAQLKSEFASQVDALFSYIAALAAQELTSS